MVKRNALPLAAMAAGAIAQGTTTMTYSVCPTATTTTITLPSTITYCPGASCNVPTITAGPTGAAYTSEILDWTFTGPDGSITVLQEYATVYPAPCKNGPGMCGATYTITEECPCTAHPPGWIHPDFTTTWHHCNSCGPSGNPTDYKATVPCDTGAYAHVTPTLGPWSPPGGGSGSYWGGQGGAGGAGGAGGNANGGGAQGGNGGAGGAGGAGGNANGAGAHGGSGGAGGAGGAGGNANNVAAATGAPAGGSGSNPVAGYKGAGNKVAVAVSSVFAIAVGAFAIML